MSEPSAHGHGSAHEGGSDVKPKGRFGQAWASVPKGWCFEVEFWCAIFMASTMISQSILFAGGQFWEDTLDLATSPDHGHLSVKELFYGWLFVLLISALTVVWPYRMLKKKGDRLEHEIEHAKLDMNTTEKEKALIEAKLSGQRNLCEFVMDAINFCLMRQWDFMLRHSFETTSVRGITSYVIGVIVFCSMLSHLRYRDVDEKAKATAAKKEAEQHEHAAHAPEAGEVEETTTLLAHEEGGEHHHEAKRDTKKVKHAEVSCSTRISFAVAATIDHVIYGLPWLIALGVQAWELQSIAAANEEHSRDFEVFYTWLFVGVILTLLLVFFALQRWWMQRHHPESVQPAEEISQEDQELVTMFRFVDLRKYGVRTSTLLLDALGIGLVNAIGDAMESTIRAREDGGFNLKHTLVFTALVLSIGFGIRHAAEYTRVRLPPTENQDSFADQMVRFAIVLSSRACSYLGGFVIQLAMAEWLIETHAEYMLGPQRAHEALAIVEGGDTLSEPQLPNLEAVKIPEAANAAHHVLAALKSRVMNDTHLMRDFHNTTTAAIHHAGNSAIGFKNATMSFLHDEHVRFEVTLVVAFAMFALVITILGVGFVMFTQMLSDKYNERLVLWRSRRFKDESDEA